MTALDDDFRVYPRLPGGSRAKRRLNSGDLWSDDAGSLRSSHSSRSLRSLRSYEKVLADARYEIRRNRTLLAEAIRTALAPLPYDVQEIIAELANFPMRDLKEPARVLFVSTANL